MLLLFLGFDTTGVTTISHLIRTNQPLPLLPVDKEMEDEHLLVLQCALPGLQGKSPVDNIQTMKGCLRDNCKKCVDVKGVKAR